MPFIALAISFGLSLLLIPLVRRLSIKIGRVAKPRDDRWHQKPTPYLGGVGIFLAFGISVFVTALLGEDQNPVQWGLLAGSGLVFLLGLIDDLKRISPPAKLVGQILAATAVVFLGYTTGFFTPRIANDLVAQIPNILLTFIWLVGITNAINLLDNMDGLAGGISLIAAAILSFFFWETGSQGLLIVSLALAGSILGFLIFNFPPATIFMGDSGSLFLGFTLAVLAIARQPQASNVFAILGVPTLIFLIPILDTTLVTFTRILRGQSPAKGGRDHTSHRLIAFGLSERQAVLVLYGVALISGVIAAALEELAYWFSLVLVPVLVASLALLTAYLGGLKVVAAPTPPYRDKTITRMLLELTYRRRLLEVILDFILIGIAYYLAFLTRYNLMMNEARMGFFLQSFPIALAGAYIAFFFFGIYRGVWRYVGVDDLLRYLKAAAGCVVLVTACVLVLYTVQEIPPIILLIFGGYLFIGLAASRSSFRILDLVSGHQARATEERVLICGAGDSGEMALRWILMNPQLEYRPVGFLDQDPYMNGRQIHGVEVLGGLEQLETILDGKQVDGVIITAGMQCNGHFMEELVATCHDHECWVRTLRLEFELIS